ncbi:MAG: glycosyltransferase family 61 protein [Rhodospirillaceae bacterium]|nr:MAG: glycosyltransferase family 61 protein [Rhodospirillaceae bacterium]
MVQTAFERIQAHVAAGAFAAADALCEDLIQADGTNAGLWHMRASIAAQAEDWIVAEIYYRRAIALAPDSGQPWFGLAKVYLATDDLELAAEAANEALKRGIQTGDEVVAHEIAARGKFRRGEVAAGRAEMAGLVPYYQQRCAAPTRDGVLSAFPGLSAAMCAGDTDFAAYLLKMIYPHATEIGPVAIAATASLAEWCAANQAPFRILDTPRDMDFPATSLHGRAISYRTDPIAIGSIAGGRWVPRFDFALAPDGTLLRDSGYMHIDATFNFLPHAYFQPANLVVHHAPAEEIFVDAEVMLLSSPADGNFGHWLIDFLPRLLARDEISGREIKIAVPESLRPKQLATLALCGVDTKDFLLCSASAQYRFRTLHVYQAGHAMPPHPRHVAFLRSRFWGARQDKPRRGKRLYLSRTSVGTRMVANREEFDRFLREEGIQSVELADLSIDAQREQLADAEVLIGGMGTNLLALYFAPPGCTVIGIIDDPALDTLIAHTCAMLGMSCQYLVSTPAGTSSKAMHARDLDFVVDCGELQRRLRELDRI